MAVIDVEGDGRMQLHSKEGIPLGNHVVGFKPSLEGVSKKNTFTQANAECWCLLFFFFPSASYLH